MKRAQGKDASSIKAAPEGDINSSWWGVRVGGGGGGGGTVGKLITEMFKEKTARKEK